MTEADLQKLREAESEKLEKTYVRDVYNKMAPHFSDKRYKAWPLVKEFLLTMEIGSLVADVGCGAGKYLSINPFTHKFGSDVCAPLINIAKDQHHHVLVCDNLCLPYRDKIFDAVISIGVIHHFSTTERRVQSIRELARTLRPGGRVMIYVWALEQKRRKFEGQDVLVPWQTHNEKKKRSGSRSRHSSTSSLSEDDNSSIDSDAICSLCSNPENNFSHLPQQSFNMWESTAAVNNSSTVLFPEEQYSSVIQNQACTNQGDGNKNNQNQNGQSYHAKQPSLYRKYTKVKCRSRYLSKSTSDDEELIEESKKNIVNTSTRIKYHQLNYQNSNNGCHKNIPKKVIADEEVFLNGSKENRLNHNGINGSTDIANNGHGNKLVSDWLRTNSFSNEDLVIKDNNVMSNNIENQRINVKLSQNNTQQCRVGKSPTECGLNLKNEDFEKPVYKELENKSKSMCSVSTGVHYCCNKNHKGHDLRLTLKTSHNLDCDLLNDNKRLKVVKSSAVLTDLKNNAKTNESSYNNSSISGKLFRSFRKFFGINDKTDLRECDDWTKNEAKEAKFDMDKDVAYKDLINFIVTKETELFMNDCDNDEVFAVREFPGSSRCNVKPTKIPQKVVCSTESVNAEIQENWSHMKCGNNFKGRNDIGANLNGHFAVCSNFNGQSAIKPKRDKKHSSYRNDMQNTNVQYDQFECAIYKNVTHVNHCTSLNGTHKASEKKTCSSEILQHRHTKGRVTNNKTTSIQNKLPHKPVYPRNGFYAHHHHHAQEHHHPSRHDSTYPIDLQGSIHKELSEALDRDHVVEKLSETSQELLSAQKLVMSAYNAVTTNKLNHHQYDSSLKFTSKKSCDSKVTSNGDTKQVESNCMRYYHVFKEGELVDLIVKYIPCLHVKQSFYDHANWCVIAEKVHNLDV